MSNTLLGRALAALAAVLLLALPPAALAQATTENTLPRGIYLPNGTQQQQTAPVGIVTKDSVSGNWCIVGSTATCILPTTGSGGGGSTTTKANAVDPSLVEGSTANPISVDLTGYARSLVKGTVNLGTIGDAATEVTLQSTVSELQGLRTDLAVPSTSLPLTEPEAAASTLYTHGKVAISTATDTTLVALTAAQTIRLHGLYCTVSAADNLTLKSNTTARSATFRFPTGGGFINWRKQAEFHIPPTTAGEALVLTTTTTANVDCDFWYRKD